MLTVSLCGTFRCSSNVIDADPIVASRAGTSGPIPVRVANAPAIGTRNKNLPRSCLAVAHDQIAAHDKRARGVHLPHLSTGVGIDLEDRTRTAAFGTLWLVANDAKRSDTSKNDRHDRYGRTCDSGNRRR